MKLFDLLTPTEREVIRKNELIRNCDVKDITVEQIKAISCVLEISETGNDIVFEASHAFDELLFRERLKHKPTIYEQLQS